MIDNWEAEIKLSIVAGTLKPIIVGFGQHEKATEDFNRDYDALLPPASPAPTFRAYFQCDGDLAAFRRRSKEIKSFDPEPWKLTVYAKGKVRLSWDVSDVPEDISLFLGSIDMRETGYTYAGKPTEEIEMTQMELTASTCLTETFELHPGYTVVVCPGEACDPLSEICKPPILPDVWTWDPAGQQFRKVASLGKGAYFFGSEAATELNLRYTP